MRYKEGLQVEYRALMRRDIPEPEFVFGYGLSCDGFEYSGFSIEDLEGPEIGVKVSVSVKNV